MNIELSQLLTSASVIVLAIMLKFIVKRILRRKKEQFGFQSGRKAMISKVMNIGLIFLTGLILLGIWEVDPEDLALYFASVFTIIGVAFFAQWSHLSNITAAIIIYFNHPVAIGDEITIQDEPSIQGKISDIGLFIMTLITEDKKKLMITNTLFLQKVLSTTIKRGK